MTRSEKKNIFIFSYKKKRENNESKETQFFLKFFCSENFEKQLFFNSDKITTFGHDKIRLLLAFFLSLSLISV